MSSSCHAQGFASVLSAHHRRHYSFGDAVLAGWADDGGMLWPTQVPQLDQQRLVAWASLSYPQLCATILKLFVPADDPDIAHGELDALVARSFPAFGSADVVELFTLEGGDVGPGIAIAELWHGPTLAFKDLGMSVLGQMLSHLLSRRHERLLLLVGTSGDTGSSAIEAVRGLPNVDIVVLYPLRGYSSITPVQERQMTSVAEVEANVTVVGVEGTSDDLDVPMEACFRDAPFKRLHALGSVNSVNVVRLLVQSVHFFYAYLRVCPAADRTVQFAVPCGAGGHLAAGLLALQMGLPARLIAATNANDAMHRVLSTGVLHAGRPSRPTASPSMDIQMPYNLWRLLYVASGGDGDAVRLWQEQLRNSVLQLPPHIVTWLAMRVGSVAVDDDETLATVRSARVQSGYFLDPHTAVGVAAARRSPFGMFSPQPSTGFVRAHNGATAEPRVCLGCAHAVKFLPSVAAALGSTIDATLAAMPECATHQCVGAVGRMARELHAAGGAAAGDSFSREGQMPPGCTTVFRRGEDWEHRLRALLASVTARRASERAGASARPGAATLSAASSTASRL